MTRYIDIDNAVKFHIEIPRGVREQDFLEGIDFALKNIESEPMADVQPVVHCVKCKYRNDISVCILNDIFINEKDFCSKGDKLDGDEHDNG